MPVVRMPDGTNVSFPDDMPREEIRGLIASKFPEEAPPSAKGPRVSEGGGALRSVDSFMRGAADTATFGMADEIAGLGSAVAQSLNPLRDYSKGFPSVSDNIQKERDIQEVRDNEDTVSSTLGRVGGGLLTATGAMRAGLSPTAKLAADASLKAKIGAGAIEGAAYGGLYGAGSGEGISDRASQAISGAAGGAVTGAAVPIVVSGVKAVAKPVVDAVKARTNPSGYAAQKISERLSASNMTPEQASNRIMQQPGTNVADVGGKSTRDLLRTAVNIPGPAKDRVNKTLTMRQFGQGDRIKDVVKDVFADPDGFITAGEKLSKEWAKVSDDVYKPALAKNVVWTDRLQQFVSEPIFKRGLAQGVKIQRLESLAAGKPFNPVDYAITGFNEAGDPIISGVPNMRALNVAKKGLDAIIGDMRNPLTGKLTEEGRATDLVRRAFLSEIDRWNPEYAQARSVWGGFAKVKEAMEFGQKEAFTLSPEAVAKSFKDMSTAEKQAARIGLADAIRKRIDAAGFTHNAVLRIFGNRQTIGVMKAAFPDQESFSAFRKAMFAEARKRATYEAVKGNSTTASQLADMMETGGLKDGIDVAKTAVTSGPYTATIQWIGSRLRMLGGLTPEVADQISRKLMTTDPAKVLQLTTELTKLQNAKVTAGQRSNVIQALVTRALQAPIQSTASQPNQQRP